jgi:hypothetical protein
MVMVMDGWIMDGRDDSSRLKVLMLFSLVREYLPGDFFFFLTDVVGGN